MAKRGGFTGFVDSILGGPSDAHQKIQDRQNKARASRQSKMGDAAKRLRDGSATIPSNVMPRGSAAVKRPRKK